MWRILVGGNGTGLWLFLDLKLGLDTVIGRG